ncbi:MAG: AAA family ATPase [Gammaproteobacteria bacterium]|nr:AAA family ATPase [Gammaproteobacteria bacterium]
MYNDHFGLKQAPFRITPDTRLFFSGGGRGDILDALVYAITSGEGIVKVVGEVGSGKTMLCRMLEERLPEQVEIVYLANPSLTPDDILQAIALEMNLEVPANANRLQVMHALQHRLVEKHANNHQVVVFIEEAQSMPIETLEEIRLLTNLETNREKLLQIVLFGQPELDDNLDNPNIRQLRERITHSFHLQPFTRQELRDYVNYRMRAAGYRGPDVFRAGAYQSLARASEGLTRRINILADKALLAAFADDRHNVDRKHVRQAVVDSRFARRRKLAPEIMMGLGIVMVIGAAVWTVFGPARSPIEPNARPELAVLDRIQPAPSAPDAPIRVAAGVKPDAPVPESSGDDAGDGVEPAPAGLRSEAAGSGNQPPGIAGVESVEMTGDSETRQVKTMASEPRQPADEPVSETEKAIAAGASAKAEPGATPPAVSASASAGADGPAASPPDAKTPVPESEPAGRAVTAPEQAPVAAAASRAGDDPRPQALLEQRLQATRDWLRETNADNFSIQLLLTTRSQRRNLEDFLKRQARPDGLGHLYVYETIINNRPYLGVLYGDFATIGAAREALEGLPPRLKRFEPFIRNVRDISSLG